MSKDYRAAAIEHFWGGEYNALEAMCRGAQVISYLRHEVSVFDECIAQYQLDEASPDWQMREKFIAVLNYIADCTENEDMRIEEE